MADMDALRLLTVKEETRSASAHGIFAGDASGYSWTIPETTRLFNRFKATLLFDKTARLC
jgi:hypothetical protein